MSPFLFALLTLYHFWSKNRNIHFGYFRWGTNPFQLEPMLAAMNEFVAAQLKLEADAEHHVLDIGCGYGATVHHLSHTHSKAHFTGVAIDGNQITEAFQLVKNGRAHFCKAEFNSIPFPDASFDRAYGLESFCFANSQKELVGEAARLLQPNGQLIILDGFRRKSAPLPYPIRFLYEKSLKAWGMRSLPILPDLIKSLEEKGFTGINYQDLSWRIAPSLLHIPRVSLKLLLYYLKKREPAVIRYLSALLLTLLLSPFKIYFGYFAVTCQKASVKLGK